MQRDAVMTLSFLFVLFLSITAGSLSAADKEDPSDELLDVTEIIEKANAGISKTLLYGDIAPPLSRNADPCTVFGCKWLKIGRYVNVPYVISSSYNAIQRGIIIKGLNSFHRYTCIRFVPKKWYHYNYLFFDSQDGCWSHVGRQWGKQYISLNKEGCLTMAIMQHEILHALGFHHEHSRSDRDKYVRILTENIQQGEKRNFEKVQTNNLGTSYDFNSVMQYKKNFFSKNGLPTIVARSNPNLEFGYATQMSANDIARVNKLYRCS